MSFLNIYLLNLKFNKDIEIKIKYFPSAESDERCAIYS